jgi:hypothetical protein
MGIAAKKRKVVLRMETLVALDKKGRFRATCCDQKKREHTARVFVGTNHKA